MSAPGLAVELLFSIRCLRGAWPLSDTQAQRLVLELASPDRRDWLHGADPKAHTFAAGPDPRHPRSGHLRITTLTAAAASAFAGPPEREVELRMGRYSLTPAREAVVVQSSELLLHLDRPAPRRLPLVALAPTRLGVGGEYKLPLPVPWLLLAEPLRSWNTYAQAEAAPTGMEEWWHANVGLSALDIHDVPFPVEGAHEPGFMGTFTLIAAPAAAADIRWRWTRLLADYAYFTGVGDRRARGAGQLRLSDEPTGRG